jgi:hypothetical protein
MTVADVTDLAVYQAFSIEEGHPAVFVLYAHNEASVFLYEHLIGVGWLKSESEEQIAIEHRFFSVYLHGKNLEPLLQAFERLTVRRIEVFDNERHEPVGPGMTVITHIDDHYEAAKPSRDHGGEKPDNHSRVPFRGEKRR